MKKVAILGIAVLLVAFGAGMALANPQADNNSGTGGLTGNTNDGSASTGSQVTGIGDVNAGGTQTITETKNFDNSTTTVDKSGQSNTKTITKDSNNTKTISGNTTAALDYTKAKNGSAAAVNGNATVNKDSGNSLTIDKSGQVKKYNKAYDTYGSAVAQDGSTATNTYTKSTTIDKSGQTNDSFNTKTITKNSNNTVASNNTVYAVDDQILVNNNSGYGAYADDLTPAAGAFNQSLTVNKTWTAKTVDSFKNINGVINYNQQVGNFNSATASTGFTLNGGVANTTP